MLEVCYENGACSESGGACDQKLSQFVGRDGAEDDQKHQEKHPDVAKEMEKMRNEDAKKWGREMKPTFDNAQEHQSATN